MKRFSQWFDVGPLGCGRTTAIAKACKKIGATMLCANQVHAKQVIYEQGIKARSIQSCSEGLRGPFLADHYAIQTVTHEYETFIAEQNVEIRALKKRIDRQSTMMDQFKDQLEAYRDKYYALLKELTELKEQACCTCCGSVLETGECARCD